MPRKNRIVRLVQKVGLALHQFLVVPAFGRVQDDANDAHSPPLASSAHQIEMSKSPGPNPPDLAVCPPDPKLGRVAVWYRGIERGVVGCPYPFHVIRMYPSHELFETGVILSSA